jgi:F-type H+-transporting ATPase subunit epsilon
MADVIPTQIQLEVVTPDRQVVHESVDEVTVPGKRGYLGILPGHAPLLSELAPGEIAYTRGGSKHYLAASWGFAEVLPNRVIVLVQSAERAEEIDLTLAQQELVRAEEQLRKTTDPTTAQAEYEKALARLQAARHTEG